MLTYAERVEKEIKCPRCDGNGSVKWTSGVFAEEIAYRVHCLARHGREPKSWKELLKLAKAEYKKNMECPECLGRGVIDG